MNSENTSEAPVSPDTSSDSACGGQTMFTYTKHQIHAMTRNFLANRGSVRATFDVSLPLWPDLNKIEEATLILCLIEKIAGIVTERIQQKLGARVTEPLFDTVDAWIVEAFNTYK